MPVSTVLVVDDEAAFRRVLRMALTAAGSEVTEAGDGKQALAAVASGHYDAVLLDVNMPVMGGIEACRELRRMQPTILILMISVRDWDQDKQMAFDAGADGYFVKPFSVGELLARLKPAAS